MNQRSGGKIDNSMNTTPSDDSGGGSSASSSSSRHSYYDTLMGHTRSMQDTSEQRFEFERAARNTIVCTAAGAATGAVIATLRAKSVRFYAVSMGFNFTICGGAFFWLREGLIYWDQRYPRLNSALAGSISGGVLSTAFAGVGKGIQGAMLFGIVGWTGQYVYDRLEAERNELKQQILNQRKLQQSNQEAEERRGSSIVDDSTFQNSMATVDTLEHCATREEAIAARKEWLRKNELNLQKYGLSTTPFDSSKYDSFWQRFAYASPEEIKLWKNTPAIARKVLTDPIVMNEHSNGDEAWIRTVRAREIARKTMEGHSNKGVSESRELSAEDVAAALEPEHIKKEASKYEDRRQGKTYFSDWIPEWFPVQAFDEEAYEKKLKTRLEKIERMLRRDDEYRRVMKAKVKLYDREVYNLRNHPELYGYEENQEGNDESRA
eukprot:gb/GECG01013661.1/.p1 GENE.gb/GECG01013661.1/~~gb/GECG01013661.1/.p1  ORF type:complete len:435 (+),score=74.85 gb/GECG01013661.1/:1-1305(+)